MNKLPKENDTFYVMFAEREDSSLYAYKTKEVADAIFQTAPFSKGTKIKLYKATLGELLESYVKE